VVCARAKRPRTSPGGLVISEDLHIPCVTLLRIAVKVKLKNLVFSSLGFIFLQLQPYLPARTASHHPRRQFGDTPEFPAAYRESHWPEFAAALHRIDGAP
jgi:hypothetical protein